MGKTTNRHLWRWVRGLNSHRNHRARGGDGSRAFWSASFIAEFNQINLQQSKAATALSCNKFAVRTFRMI